jgi:hypothetical protein
MKDWQPDYGKVAGIFLKTATLKPINAFQKSCLKIAA